MKFMLSESYALIPTCEAASKYFGPKFVDGKLTKLFPPARFQLRRVDDWQQRLRCVLEQNQATPYRFGLFDCVYLCGLAIEAVTGHLLRFEYDGLEGSQRQKFIEHAQKLREEQSKFNAIQSALNRRAG